MSFDPFLLLTSFIAGLLTILAPCVLPLLPVIVGGAAGSRNKWYPVVLTVSLSLSVILFTLLLKFSTLLIDIPQTFWKSVSAGILILFGLTWFLPKTWESISNRFNLLGSSQAQLAKARKVESMWGAVLMGAALGPVFSSCSPTYFVILAVVLPVSFFLGVFYLLVYGLGLAIMLGLIAFFGQKLTSKLGWLANPEGWFKKIMGVLLILVGLSIVTGVEKKIETAILDTGFGVTNFERGLLEKTEESKSMHEGNLTQIDDGSGLPQLYQAPELSGVENWINSSPINSMAELKGKVVLIDFWTYSCINCIRTLPYLQSWQEKYSPEGLVIIAVHAPEFQFERKLENVQKAVKDFGLTYPVVQDNDKNLWKAYHNQYWPAKYLIDKEGIVRYEHFGEGKYEETERNIAALLKTDVKASEVKGQDVDFSQIGTPETYLGTNRRMNFIQAPEAVLKQNEWTLKGNWEVSGEKIVSTAAQDSIRMNFTASKANLVIGGKGTATVLIDGKKAQSKDVKEGRLSIDGYRLYELSDYQGDYQMHEIELIFDQPNIELYAWTFG